MGWVRVRVKLVRTLSSARVLGATSRHSGGVALPAARGVFLCAWVCWCIALVCVLGARARCYPPSVSVRAQCGSCAVL